MISRLLSSVLRKCREIKCITLRGKYTGTSHLKRRMDNTALKPLIWLHFGSDEFGFNVKGKFGAKDFLKTNNDFRIVFDEDIANATGDVLSEISGLWVCTRNTKFMEMLENMPNVKVQLFTLKFLLKIGEVC